MSLRARGEFLVPERLKALRHVTTIESIGSSPRIEGSKLTDQQVEVLLSKSCYIFATFVADHSPQIR